MQHRNVSAETRAATSSMIERWAGLSADIAAGIPRNERSRGTLRVIGSGLAHADLTLNDEAAIRDADHVFYCLYDRVTQVWIDKLRPDALDLRILWRTAGRVLGRRGIAAAGEATMPPFRGSAPPKDGIIGS